MLLTVADRLEYRFLRTFSEADPPDDSDRSSDRPVPSPTVVSKFREVVKNGIRQGRRLTDDAVKEAATLVDEYRQSVLDRVVRTRWDAYMLPQMKASVTAISEDFARKYDGALDESTKRGWRIGSNAVTQSLVPFNITTPSISTLLLESTLSTNGEMIQGLTADARRNIMQQVRLGALGKSREAVIEEIGASLDQSLVFRSIRARAEAISATETGKIFNTASHQATLSAQTVSDRVVQEWLHAPPGAVRQPRPTHLALHGTTIKEGEMFNVSGYSAKHPHDSSLPASEVVFCACYSVANVLTDGVPAALAGPSQFI